MRTEQVPTIDVEWMSPEAVASHLGVPVATVRAWRYRGTGPTGYRVGKHVRYRRTEVDEWVMRGAGAATVA